jgi:hypothetical protein
LGWPNQRHCHARGSIEEKIPALNAKQMTGFYYLATKQDVKTFFEISPPLVLKSLQVVFLGAKVNTNGTSFTTHRTCCLPGRRGRKRGL